MISWARSHSYAFKFPLHLPPRWLNIFCSVEVSDVLGIVKQRLINRDGPRRSLGITLVRCKVDDSDSGARDLANHLAQNSKTILRRSPKSLPIYLPLLHDDLSVPRSWIFDTMPQLGGRFRGKSFSKDL